MRVSYAYESSKAYCNQEEFVSSGVESYVHVCLHKWNKFALCCLLVFHEFSPDSALDNQGASQVSHPKHQAIFSIALKEFSQMVAETAPT